MDNVEGDYDEIVAWMDAHPVRGVGFATERGCLTNEEDPEENEFERFNVGLFSLCYTETSKGIWNMWFSRLSVEVSGGHYVTISDAEDKVSHLITF